MLNTSLIKSSGLGKWAATLMLGASALIGSNGADSALTNVSAV